MNLDSPLASYRPQPSLYRRIIDPRNTLPQLEIVRDPDFSSKFGENSFDIWFRGLIVGEFNLDITSVIGRDRVFFNGIRRDGDASLLKGIGMATYLIMAETYAGYFGSDDTLSEHSLKMWRRLSAQGIASCLREPDEITTQSAFKYIGANFTVVDSVTY